MPFNNDSLLVTSKLCTTYYSAIRSTEFACGFHVSTLPMEPWIQMSGNLCFDRCMHYPAENMQTNAVKKVS